MSVSVDGYLADRTGAFGWTAPSDELFAFHLEQVRDLGACLCGRRLYETMLPWETDRALRATDQDVEIGGAGLAGQALERGLVDEFRIFRYPVIVGGGTPLIPPVTDQIDLQLIETRTFNSRVIFERYARAASSATEILRCPAVEPSADLRSEIRWPSSSRNASEVLLSTRTWA